MVSVAGLTTRYAVTRQVTGVLAFSLGGQLVLACILGLKTEWCASTCWLRRRFITRSYHLVLAQLRRCFCVYLILAQVAAR